jgi:Zn-dependent protease with chaperone function
MPGNASEAAVRALIARQRARTRVLAGVAAGTMLLDTGIIALIVATVTRSAAGVLVVPCVIGVAVLVTVTVIRHPERRAGFLGHDAAREYLNRVEPVVARVAAELHIAVPEVRIIDDQALNALSAGSDRDGMIAYTSGILDAIDGDQPLATVTAHLAGRLACGDNGLVVFSYGVLAWILESFDVIVMRLVRWLRRIGKKCVDFAFGRDTGFHGDEASFYARLLLFVFALALGLELLVAALALFVVGGALALAAAVTVKTQAQQRMRFADAIAAELTGSETVHETLGRLSGQPTELTRGGVTLQDLCFAGPRPHKGYVQYTPDIQRRLAWLGSGAQSRSTGLAAPVASAVALIAALGALGLAAVNIPYGQPFSTTSRPAGVPLAETGSSSSDPATTGTIGTPSGAGSTSPPTVTGSPGLSSPPPSVSPSPSQPLTSPKPKTGPPGPGSSPAARYAWAVIADQPTAYWQFNDAPGTARYADSSGQGNTLPAGPTTLTSPGPAAGTAAISTRNGGTLTTAPLGPLTGDAPRTVEAWFRTTATGCIFSAGQGAHTQALSLCLRDGPVNAPTPGIPGLYFETYDADIFVPIANLTDGTWHYLAVTLTGNMADIVIDGTQHPGYIWNGDPSMTGGGAYGGLTAQPFTLPYTPDTAATSLGVATAGIGDIGGGLVGTIAEVAVYPSALPVAALISHYQLLPG